MIIGGVSASLSRVDGICEAVEHIRSQSPYPQDSLQWKHITNRKFHDYERLAELALHLISEHIIDFTAVVINRAELKHHQFNEGDGEVGFQKFLCELFLAYPRKYRYPPHIECFHGQRDSKFTTEYIRSMLNGRTGKNIKYNYLPFVRYEYLEPSLSPMHQLNDFVLGVTSWHWNPGMRQNLESPKSRIAQAFRREVGYEMLAVKTPPSAPHFDIWKLKLS